MYVGFQGWNRGEKPWWSPVREAAASMLVYAACFSLLVCGAAYGSALTAWASRVIESKFILHALNFLEYAVVVVDGAFILLHPLRHLFKALKRFFR